MRRSTNQNSQPGIPKNGNATHAGNEDGANTQFIEGIDDLEEDVCEQLPSQEHRLWLVNIIRIHARKMAKEVLQEHEDKSFTQPKQEVSDLTKSNEQLQPKLEIDQLKRSKDGKNRDLAKKKKKQN